MALTSKDLCTTHGTDNHYIIGPYGEVRLPAGFSVEIEALYRSFSSSYRGEPQTAGGNWEFPVLVKYKLIKSGPLMPYIEGGLVFSHLTCSDLNVAHDSNYGIALGPASKSTRWCCASRPKSATTASSSTISRATASCNRTAIRRWYWWGSASSPGEAFYIQSWTLFRFHSRS
jgi:hypothetical protein